MTDSTALVKIVNDSGLEQSKAQVILNRFNEHATLAAEWEKKAKTIVVTDISQTAEMGIAREGRLQLRAKRIEIEKLRKDMKEQSLKEGKAIDGIAKYLTGLIEPTEDYLGQQEKFAEIQEDKRKEALSIERTAKLQPFGIDLTLYDLKEMAESSFQQLLETNTLAKQQREAEGKRIEAERVAKEKRDTEEREKLRAETERLKKEAAETEKKHAEERAALEAKAKKEKDAAAAKFKKEREEKERLEAELKAKADAEAKAKKDAAERERKAQAAPDKEKLLAFADYLKKITFPSVASEEAGKIVGKAREVIEGLFEYVRDETANL